MLDSGRYLLQHSQTQPDGWVCTDRENGIVCRFTEHKFNETQKMTFLEDVPNPNPLAIARLMREMGDWLASNHAEIVNGGENKSAKFQIRIGSIEQPDECVDCSGLEEAIRVYREKMDSFSQDKIHLVKLI